MNAAGFSCHEGGTPSRFLLNVLSYKNVLKALQWKSITSISDIMLAVGRYAAERNNTLH